DTSLCQRYVCAKIEDISAKPSSLEIRTYLWRVGIRPVNCIVDITNYVMMATGQPLHAFDLKKIEGNIKVRCAYDSEKILLLDGKEISLCKEDLVVADKNGPLALAGIIGGKRGSISSDTSQILIEIANFDHVSVRRTAMRYKIRTESAVRNEKGIDLERCDIALTLALRMFENFFPSAIANFSDNYQRRSKIVKINVSLPWLEKNIDKNIEDSDIIKLNRLGFKINLTVDTMHVVVPSWRSTGDVSLPNDIMEEIIRIHGFENFKLKPIKILIENSVNQLAEDMDRKIREYLALRCGMNEIFTYPWISDEYIKAILPNEIDSMLSLSSPPSSDERYIRPSLVPGICKAVMKNLRFFDEFGLFESAHVFLNKNFESKYDLRESLPFQSRNVAGACVGNLKNITLLFRKAKGIISCLPRYVQLEALSFDKIEKPTWADDNLWINIIYNQKKIGDLALLSKKASLDCKIKNSALIIFELCIDSLKPYVSRTNKFIKICEYPETEHDISLLFDLSVKWEEIFDTIISKKYSIIRNVNFVDEYRGYHISDDKKSVTIRIKIGLLDRTLTSKEIETCIANIIDCLNKKFGAKIRC
ncbi:MAG: phenylalanine--tRNA ligase subunit beta, partial [Firmicutes bacterium]|nr:phenylalanine--tRNA ligase subunit beta [Bacillota bacterium]